MGSRRKHSLCVLCYTLISPSNEDKMGGKTCSKTFLQLIARHLNIVSGFQLNSRNLSTCEECSKIGESFCKLFTEMESIRVQLDYKIGRIYEMMTFADRVRTGLQASLRLENSGDENNENISSDIQGLRSQLMRHCKLKLDSSLPRVHMKQRTSNGDNGAKSEKRSPQKLVYFPNKRIEVLAALMTFLAVLHISLPMHPSLIPTHYHQLPEQAEQCVQENEEPDNHDSEQESNDDVSDAPPTLQTVKKSSKLVRFHNDLAESSSNNEIADDSDSNDEESEDEKERPRIPGKTGNGWIVEAVRDYRIGQNGKVQYRTKWKHWPEYFNSWEPESNFISKEPIEHYWKEVRKTANKLNSPFNPPRNRKRKKCSTDKTDPSYFLDF